MQSWRSRLIGLVDSRRFQIAIITVIALNGAILGVLSTPGLDATLETWLRRADDLCMAIFVTEITLKLVAHRGRFFRDGWNIFDFLVIAFALLPATGELSVLRAFRILRALRLMSALSSMRRVITGLLRAIPGVSATAGVLLLTFYIFSVLATSFFGARFAEWFGHVGASMYTLFQIMTLESWSMGIVRPVMEVYPLAWAFFVPFIFVTAFAVLNLFIGIVVNALQSVDHEEHAAQEAERERRRDQANLAMADRMSRLEAQSERIEVMLRDVHAGRNRSPGSPEVIDKPGSGPV